MCMVKRKKIALTVACLVALIGLLVFASTCVYAHEQWFLTPKQILLFDSKPRPHIFTELSITNISIILFVCVFLYAWVLLGRTGAREIFPDLQIRLASYTNAASLVLRIGTAAALLMAVFGLNPREGVGYFVSPAFIFPDLELHFLNGYWVCIQSVELLIAIGLLFGVYVRMMAGILLLMSVLGLYLFGYPMLSYIGFLAGIALYLILKGPGIFYVHLPIIKGTKSVTNWLENRPPGQAQFLLRVLAGLNFAYAGIVYKILQPNLAIGLLSMRHMPTFGLHIATIVLWMALVETLAGILLMAGVLIRPMSMALLGSFIFLGLLLHEPLYSHAIFFGVLIACYLNGAGQARGIAKDKSATIVIFGASISGIHSAIKLERLSKNVSNLKIIIIHHENYFQFDPLLPEVISGAVQPGHIINSIRRICPTALFIQGQVKYINFQEQKIDILLLSGDDYRLSYDQLIVASDKIIEHASITGLGDHSLSILNIGDALLIRHHILECLEQAESTKEQPRRQQLLTFSVIGGGLRGCSFAAEILKFIQSAIISYPALSLGEVRILLLVKSPTILPTFDLRFSKSIHQALSKMKINIMTHTKIKNIENNCIVLFSGEKIQSNTIICALSKHIPFMPVCSGLKLDGRLSVDDRLQVYGIDNVFAVGMSASFVHSSPFQALSAVKMGKLAAYNAWAKLQGYPLMRWKMSKRYFYLASLGKDASVAACGPFVLKGRLAWYISRVVCMLTMPGLEKNLRVLIDWGLSIPFRQDIVTFTPTTINNKSNYQHIAFSDVETKRKKRNSDAYLLLSDRVAILKTLNGTIKQFIALEPVLLENIKSLQKTEQQPDNEKNLASLKLSILSYNQFYYLFSHFLEPKCKLPTFTTTHLREMIESDNDSLY